METRITGMAAAALVVAAGLIALAIIKRKAAVLWILSSIIGIMVLFTSTAALYALHIEPSMLTVTERTIINKELPPCFEGKRVAFITDIHFGKYYKEKDFARLAERINKLNADILLIGGDTVDRSISPADVDPSAVAGLFKSIHAPLGMYAVEGNHDLEDRNTRAFMQRVYAEAGIRVLRNEHAFIRSGGGRIAIAGLQESYFRKPDADAAYKGIPEGTFTIGMIHEPDIAVQFTPHRTPLVLAGHSHGGIVVLPFMGPLFKVWDAKNMTKGVYKAGDTEVYVSNGIGFVIIKARFCDPPEIVVYTLKRKVINLMHQ